MATPAIESFDPIWFELATIGVARDHISAQGSKPNCSAIRDFLNCVGTNPMLSELPRMLCELAIIQEDQLAFCESILANVSVMPSFIAGLLDLMMEIHNKPIFLQSHKLH